MLMRRQCRRSVLSLVLTLLLVACRPPTSIVTEPGKTAYRADQIAVRVNELQKAAIAAEAKQGLSTETTRRIVTFSVSANRILQTTPEGWRVSVEQLWTETKKQLPPLNNLAVQTAVDAVDVAIAVVTTGGPQ